MYRPNGIENVYSYTTKTRQIPPILQFFFFALTFIFGMDFGFIKLLYNKYQRIAKVVTVTLSLIIIFVLTEPLVDAKKDYYWCTIVLMQYTCNFLVLQSAKYTVCDFFLGLQNVDKRITSLNRSKIGVVTWMYGLFMYGSKFIFMYYYCTDFYPELCYTRFVPFYVYTMIGMSVDLVFVGIIAIYAYIYFCVQYLNEIFSESDTSLLQLKNRYMAIADCYDKIKPLYQKLIVVQMMMELPKMMGMLWNLLNLIKENDGWFAYFSEALFALHILIHIFCSATLVQMVISQVDTLKMKLHNIVVAEQDMRRHGLASRLVAYLEARRLQHDVVGVVPVDLRLPVSFVSVCATYLIVAVQFTHLYD